MIGRRDIAILLGEVLLLALMLGSFAYFVMHSKDVLAGREDSKEVADSAAQP